MRLNLSDVLLTRVKDIWGKGKLWKEPDVLHWTQHRRVQERLNFLASGDSSKNRFEYFMEKYLRLPVMRALTLGCGHGELERGLSQYNFALAHDGVDIAESAIANASRLAREAGLSNLHYSIEDMDRIQLPRDNYDVVFGISSFHHVLALERLMIQVSRTLKPGGYLFLDEYIGPNRFQWPDEQLAIVNEQIMAMPSRFKVCLSQRNAFKLPMQRHTIKEVAVADPSEAIRSADILPLAQAIFDVVEVKGCGGALLHLLLEHIAGNFSDNDPEAVDYLSSMFDLEDRLTAAGQLRHNFAIIIAKKRKALGA
jgi:O-antigen biosynthesis protein